MSKHPWFRFWAVDWLSDESVAVMSLASRGAYIHLLAYQWREGSIPADGSAIAKLLGEPCPSDVLANFAPRKDGRLVNARLEKERVEDEKFREERARAGKNGAKKRWQKHGSAIGLPMAKHSQSESESESEKRGKKRRANAPANPLALELFHEFECARLASIPNANHLRPTTANVGFIASRLADGYTADDVRHVIAVCVSEVRKGGEAKWFNPSAAFRPANFDRHLATDPGARVVKPGDPPRAEPLPFEQVFNGYKDEIQ